MFTNKCAWLVAFLLAATASTEAHSAQCLEAIDLPQKVERVGETRLRVMFFKVYDALLATNTGDFPNYQTLALELNYLRNIKADTLVDTTADEWKKQGIEVTAEHEQWLTTLRSIWPDVQEGDCLVALHERSQGLRFYNANGELGIIESDTFAEDFLAIWLGEKSSFEKNRDQLLGVE
ncbi:chalcone isomerase family protein [Aliidiomarina celeris]|uniref:chalcone isomerase family protein n=1 Tax=Aliidiomarina celeris TaxID=2249428 RepID=UPI000DEAB6A4|nr:chalcone isomerase family protein [Aliidiomarina celeris]